MRSSFSLSNIILTRVTANMWTNFNSIWAITKKGDCMKFNNPTFTTQYGSAVQMSNCMEYSVPAVQTETWPNMINYYQIHYQNLIPKCQFKIQKIYDLFRIIHDPHPHPNPTLSEFSHLSYSTTVRHPSKMTFFQPGVLPFKTVEHRKQQ